MAIATINGPGGPLWWQGDCGSQSSYMNQPDGFITSPGYLYYGRNNANAQPHYANNLRCEYRIEVAPGARILFVMVALSLEQPTQNWDDTLWSDCRRDYVQIFSGDERRPIRDERWVNQNEIYPIGYHRILYGYSPSNEEANGTWHYEAQHGRMCGTGLDGECFIGVSQDYTGDINTTISGRGCQYWGAQTPHAHDHGTEMDHFKHGVHLPYNFCRNTLAGHGAKSGPWCYTTDPDKEWELCGIPECREESQHLWSISNVATVRFLTDNDVTSTGFLLRWTTVYPKIDSEMCGLRPDIHLPDNGASEINPQISKRISGGQNARANTWLFACQIKYRKSGRPGLCGGTVVRSIAGVFFMITAGHCVTHDKNNIRVICFTDGRLVKVWGHHYNEELDIVRTVIHPGYRWSSNPKNDIAVVELRRRNDTHRREGFAEYLLAACLPNRKHNLMAHNMNGDVFMDKAITLGWGRVDRHNADPLQQVVVHILNQNTCFELSALCVAKGPSSSLSNPTRGGDSGSALLTFRYNWDWSTASIRNYRWTLTAVAAVGTSRMAYMTDVFAYRSWINQIINN